MLRNDYILKNDEYIFKSQAVDSYLSINTACGIYFNANISGLTQGTSVSMFYQTPTATIKKTQVYDGSANFWFNGTNETSYKNIYICGNLDSITSIVPHSSSNDGKYTGNFVKFINQFPNLTSIDMTCREFDFNQDISYSEIPPKVISFNLYDRGICGDITTIKNINNVRCWCLYYTHNLSGNFHNINFNGNLECTDFYRSNICVNIECLINNNPNYNHSNIRNTPSIVCANNINVSNLKYINWCLPYNLTVNGTLTHWTFNTGLTSLQLTAPFCGDVTTWDISNTRITSFILCGYSNYENICGDMSAWVLPNTLNMFNIGYVSITCLPTNFSNTSVNNMNVFNAPRLSGDVTTILFPTGNTYFNFNASYTSLSGNLECFGHVLTGSTFVSLGNNCFSGNLSGLTFNPNVNGIYLHNNYLTGRVNDLNIPTSLNTLVLCGNSNICLDLTSSFDTKNIHTLNLNEIGGVTGNFSNMIVGNNLNTLSMNSTNVPDINNLNLNQIATLCLSFSSLCGNITNKFVNPTNLVCLFLYSNMGLSGDTSNWNVDNMSALNLASTSLSGRLKHSCPFCLDVSNSKINSCINIDWDLTKRIAYLNAYSSNVKGDLSTINLNYGTICNMYLWTNPYLSGATGFANKIFDERKSFLRTYVYINWSNISDIVTGTSETLGDLGTYTGHQWDLTETQVNNLALGLDYDGLGSNTCWDPKQKIYWVKNARVGSSSPTRRYPLQLVY